MSNARIVLILFILSETLVAWYAAQAAWRTRSRIDHRRKIIGMMVAAGLTFYGIAQMLTTISSIKYGVVLSQCVPKDLETRSLISGAIRTTAFWVFALAWTGDEAHPGPIRRRLYRSLERFR